MSLTYQTKVAEASLQTQLVQKIIQDLETQNPWMWLKETKGGVDSEG